MTFGKAISTVLLRKYCCFSGRAPRSEYWWFQLFAILLMLVLGSWEMFCEVVTIDMYWTMTGVFFLIHYALLLPSVGVWIRRLHDRGKSGVSCVVAIGCGEILLLWHYANEIAIYSRLFSRYSLYGSFTTYFLLFVSLLGSVAGLYSFWQCLFKGTEGPNAYGPDPLA